MKYLRLYLPLILATLLASSYQQISFADYAAGTNAQQIVTKFNNMNGGVGYKFSVSRTGDVGEIRVQKMAGTEALDLGAYSIDAMSKTSDGLAYFQTFCVASDIAFDDSDEHLGKMFLDSAGKVKLRSALNDPLDPSVLNLGVAYLYKQFASGALVGYDYINSAGRSSSAVLLQNAIWFLLNQTDAEGYNTLTSWDDNIFLRQLKQIDGNLGNWTADYMPDYNYGNLMGDFKVLVVTAKVADSVKGHSRQSMLYLAKIGCSSVPEPATLAIWTLGSLGFIGSACRQRFAKKKNA